MTFGVILFYLLTQLVRIRCAYSLESWCFLPPSLRALIILFFLQVRCSDWTMIPAENLVSAAGGTPTRIAVEVSVEYTFLGHLLYVDLPSDVPETWASCMMTTRIIQRTKR